MKLSFIPLLLLALLPLVLASDEEPTKPTKPSWWSWLNPFGNSDEYPLPVEEWKPDWPVAWPDESWIEDNREKDQTPPSSTAEDPLPTSFPVPEDLPVAKAETAEDPVPTSFPVTEEWKPWRVAWPENQDKREREQTPPISAAEDPLPTSYPVPEDLPVAKAETVEDPVPTSFPVTEEWKPNWPVAWPDESWIQGKRERDQTPPISPAEDPLPTSFPVPEDLPVAKAEDPVPTSFPVTEEWKPDWPVAWPDEKWNGYKRDHKSPASSDNTPEDRTSGDVPTAASASNEKSERVLPQNDDQPDKPTIGGRIKGFFSNLWKPKNAATQVNSHQIKDHDAPKHDVPVLSDERLTKDAKTDKPTIANRVKGIFSKISNIWKPNPTPTISDDKSPAETDKPSKPNGVLSNIWNTTKATASRGVNSVKGMFSKKENEEENSDHTSEPTQVPHTYLDVQPPVTKSPSRHMNTWAEKIMRLPVYERFRLFKSGPSRIPKETSEKEPGVFQKVGRFCKGVVCSIADIHNNLANHFG